MIEIIISESEIFGKNKRYINDMSRMSVLGKCIHNDFGATGEQPKKTRQRRGCVSGWRHGEEVLRERKPPGAIGPSETPERITITRGK